MSDDRRRQPFAVRLSVIVGESDRTSAGSDHLHHVLATARLHPPLPLKKPDRAPLVKQLRHSSRRYGRPRDRPTFAAELMERFRRTVTFPGVLRALESLGVGIVDFDALMR